MQSPQSPKEILTALLTPLLKMESSIKKPLADAGFPDIPTPAQMSLRMAAALPELPALQTLFPFVPPLPVTKPPVAEELVTPELIVRYG